MEAEEIFGGAMPVRSVWYMKFNLAEKIVIGILAGIVVSFLAYFFLLMGVLAYLEYG